MSVAETHLPATMEVRDLLTGLLGREVTLTPTVPLVPGPANPASLAVYVDDRLVVRAVIVCDLPLSAWAGAALALVPPAAATAAVEAGTLDDALRENLYEVLNVAASLFNAPDAVHVRLLDLHPAGAPLAPETRMRALTLGRREDLAVTVAGYGEGRLSIVMT